LSTIEVDPRSRLDVHGLDECDAATYTHLALRAEVHVQRQLLAQAPQRASG
jgi:hypothetical protein